MKKMARPPARARARIQSKEYHKFITNVSPVYRPQFRRGENRIGRHTLIGCEKRGRGSGSVHLFVLRIPIRSQSHNGYRDGEQAQISIPLTESSQQRGRHENNFIEPPTFHSALWSA